MAARRSLYVLSSTPKQGVGNGKATWLSGHPRKVEGLDADCRQSSQCEALVALGGRPSRQRSRILRRQGWIERESRERTIERFPRCSLNVLFVFLHVLTYCNQFHQTASPIVVAQGRFVEDHSFASHNNTHVGGAEIDSEVWSALGSKGRKVHHSLTINVPDSKVSE